MKLSFLDFWGDLDLQNNFLTEIIKLSKDNIEITTPELADVIICSVFGEQHKNYFGSKKIIWFTGENIRPDFKTFDYSLSFDFDDYNGRNIRLPLWYFYIDWFNKGSYGNPQYLIPENYLYEPNEFSNKPKSKFCCSVFSKVDLDRFRMMNLLNSYKPVDGFGKIHNNRLPDGEKAKMDKVSEYKFSICFENSIFPGYFTEKLLHAKIAGTIPIYKSHETFNLDFNPDCCLNLCNLSFEDLMENIVELDRNQNSYLAIAQQPLFKNKIDLGPLANKISKIL